MVPRRRRRRRQRGDEKALFATRSAEAELGREMRLSELWEHCQQGQLTMDEFFEFSALITEVNGITGSLCVDCAMLDRPNVSSNWALATTTLCARPPALSAWLRPHRRGWRTASA